MTEPAALSDLELAALVSSRICHDVINPVAAIANGLEMLGDEPDEAMWEAAMDLIRKSAAQASAKLQFARLAYGAAGSAGAEIDLRDAEKVARDFVRWTGKHQVNWRARGHSAQEQGQTSSQPRRARPRGPAARGHHRCRDRWNAARGQLSCQGYGRCGAPCRSGAEPLVRGR